MSGDGEDLDSGFEAISGPDSPAAATTTTVATAAAMEMPSPPADAVEAVLGASDSSSSGPLAMPPSAQSVAKQSRAALEDDDDEELNETVSERLWGLTEMFPERLRSATSTLVSGTHSAVCGAYGLSRSVMWVFFSSAAILAAPLMFELERAQVEEMSKQQQRQILLGPSAALQQQQK